VIRIEFSVDIGRPPSEVFAYLTDASKLPEWQSGVVEAHWEGGQAGPGARAKQVRDFHGKQTEGLLEVAVYEPDRRFAIKTLSGPAALSLEYTLEAANGGTRLSFSGQGEMGGAAKIAGPLVARKVQKQFKSDVETLKRKLEAGAR
jgi:carbon monoxide dehydrogenase subunit G